MSSAAVPMPGPLTPYVDGFAAVLTAEGYAARTVTLYRQYVGQLSRWLEAHSLGADVLSEGVIEEFLVERHATGHQTRLRVGSFASLLAYLRDVGVIGSPEQVPAGEVDALLLRFAGYLTKEQGLAQPTVSLRVQLMRPFLVGLTEHGSLDLPSMTAEDVTTFIVAESQVRPASVPPTVTALRSLLRFLHVEGFISAGLTSAVPTASGRRLAGLPKALPAEQVAAMLATCDRDTAVGRRNLAILTLLARLGLRSGEVARLRLEHIDWRRGEIMITGKGSRHERLPLPGDAGSAIVAYLQDGRQAGAHREVFLCARGPYRPMSPDTVSNVAAAAARKAGLGIVRGHRLRHSAATAMLAAGGSLTEIGQVLRHQHTATTAIYAKVDIAGLRRVARPWPTPEAAA
ncbi:site-specific integrase [Plantactinospora sp. KBS50]|uniref:site-specific integrase n=1 Tax=Plantactinospora sp. KBS50 TaxID=2024580 RepID=UPI0012FD7721|nr:site-specific integrase [Plantactinospora sp. KBS50]